MSYIGRSVKRVEDLPLLLGKGRFASDISIPNQLFMRVVRSPLAFGRLQSIETEAAKAVPGVTAVWTRDDVAHIGPIDFRQVRIERLTDYRQFILANNFVRYVGEPVAVVFAEDAYLAEDAAELVFPDIEELTPTRDAAKPEGRFDDSLGTEAAVIEKSYGELETAFERAHRIIEMELTVVHVSKFMGHPKFPISIAMLWLRCSKSIRIRLIYLKDMLEVDLEFGEKYIQKMYLYAWLPLSCVDLLNGSRIGKNT